MTAPIPAVSPVRPFEAQLRHLDTMAAQLGELLTLRAELAADGRLLGRNGRQAFELPSGLAQAGETLLMRVQALQPKLELQLVQRNPPAGAAAPSAAPEAGSAWPAEGGQAMRTEQAWLLRQRLLPAATGATAAAAGAQMAGEWRALALAESLRAASAPAAADNPQAQPTQAGAPLQLLGWSGQALWLRLLGPSPATLGWTPPVSADEEPAAQRQHEHESEIDPDESGEGLRLGLILSLDGDWVQLLLQWQQGGLLLHLSAERPETLQALRGLLPRISAALAAVPLPLRHCQLSSRPPALPPLPRTQQASGLAHASSGPLFRAAAEIAAVLQQQHG